MKKISTVFFYIGLLFLLSACGTDAAGNIRSSAEETKKSDVIADKEPVKEDAPSAENSMGNDGNAVAEDGTDGDAGENGSYLISRSGGSRMSIQKSGISESAIGMVTGAYFLEVLEKDGINYIRIKQYVAGEDKTDHVGDVVCIVGLSDGGLTLLEEKTEAVLKP